MEFTPLYRSWTDKQLYNVLSNDEKWTAEAQEAARKELLDRNISTDEINKKTGRGRDIVQKAKYRKQVQLLENAKIGYTWLEVGSIVLFFPFTLFFQPNVLAEFARLEELGYKRKMWQRVLLIIFSFLFWIGLVAYI